MIASIFSLCVEEPCGGAGEYGRKVTGGVRGWNAKFVLRELQFVTLPMVGKLIGDQEARELRRRLAVADSASVGHVSVGRRGTCVFAWQRAPSKRCGLRPAGLEPVTRAWTDASAPTTDDGGGGVSDGRSGCCDDRPCFTTTLRCRGGLEGTEKHGQAHSRQIEVPFRSGNGIDSIGGALSR